MILSVTCLLLLSFISTVVSSEFSLKGDTCSKFDSCYSKSTLRTCSCDSSCHVFGTCCHDVKKSDQDASSGEFRCYHRRTVTPVFVKRSCAEDFQGHIDNKLACYDEDEDEMDVKNNLLVTSHKTKITYWNSHCAACNREAEEDLEFWSIEVYCPPHESVNRGLIRRNLTYDEDKKQWGLHIEGEFLQCTVKYAPPPYIDEAKHCTPNLISSCPDNFKNEEIAKKCLEYYAERKLKNSDTYYRNIHCAICNGIDVTDLECQGMTTPEDIAEESDFGDMIEQVFTKDNWLSHMEFVCTKGYTYDPLRKKCRFDDSLNKVFTPPPIASYASDAFGTKSLAMFLILYIFLF